jgi:uncharacterized membrane protein (UPF0127 family)
MKVIMIIIFLILSFFGIVIFTQKKDNHKSSLTINNVTFNIEIAKTDSEKSKGLAKYKTIEENFGMYFPFITKDYYAFWMKDMKFPIDILYISDGKIVEIFKDAKNPKSKKESLTIYRPGVVADGVFEIKAGLSVKHNFKIGDKVIIKTQ